MSERREERRENRRMRRMKVGRPFFGQTAAFLSLNEDFQYFTPEYFSVNGL
jgi:hypothetical protein